MQKAQVGIAIIKNNKQKTGCPQYWHKKAYKKASSMLLYQQIRIFITKKKQDTKP